jgi:hypothetical protein
MKNADKILGPNSDVMNVKSCIRYVSFCALKDYIEIM